MKNIWRNVVDGINKFCTENKFSDVALGLSGGLDSAVVAVAAAEALGGKHVHAFMMKTDNTSDLSISIARQISELNSLNFKELDIQPTTLDFLLQQETLLQKSHLLTPAM